MACEGEPIEAADPIEAFRREYAMVAQRLFDELERHGRDHGCAPGRDVLRSDSTCGLYLDLRSAWSPFFEMSEALEWLVGGHVPEWRGRPTAPWARDFVVGPWMDWPESQP